MHARRCPRLLVGALTALITLAILGGCVADDGTERRSGPSPVHGNADALVPVPTGRDEQGGSPSERPGLESSVSTLELHLVPPPNSSLAGARISFEGVEGKRNVVEVPASEPLVRLDVAGCYRSACKGLVGRLTVESSGCAAYGRWISAEELQGASTLELRVELEAEARVEVRVQDVQGRVAEGAVVLAVMNSEPLSAGTVREHRFECDRNGRARLATLSPGEWLLRASQWKDWEGSAWTTVTLAPGANAADARVLVVERWGEATYASGLLVAPAEWGGVAYLEDCTFPQRTYPVYGDEFFLSSADGPPISARPVSRTGGLKGTCIEFAPGSHGRQVSVGN